MGRHRHQVLKPCPRCGNKVVAVIARNGYQGFHCTKCSYKSS